MKQAVFSTEDPTELLFTHLMEEVEDFAIFLLDPAGRFATWNPGVERLLGYTESEFIGQPFSSIFTPEDIEKAAHEKELGQAEKGGRAEDERWHRRRDGSTFWASGVVTRVTAPGGETQGYVKIMRDRTGRKLHEIELARYAEQLARSNSDLRQFAGTVSHDLNAPLQTVLGFATVAAEESRDGDESITEPLEHIVRGTKQMLALISELLELSQVASRESRFENVDANGAVRSAVENLGAAIKRSGARLEIEELPRVVAEHTALTRVFQNLIDNAIKYSRPGIAPEISVTAEQDRDSVSISIVDRGIGMNRTDSERAFGLFERIVRDTPGHGMGLAICRRLVESMDGTLSVESEPGAGSTFTLTLRPADTGCESESLCHEVGTAIGSSAHDAST